MSDLNAAWLAGTFGPSAAILNWTTISSKTGSLTGAIANAPLFAFRNSGVNIAWLNRISVSLNLTTSFGSPQGLDIGLFACRAFSASDSGGAQLALSGTNNAIHRTSQKGFSSCDMRIASNAPLSIGTRTLDAMPVGIVGAWASSSGAAIPLSVLFAFTDGDYPLVFAPGEGFEVQALSSLGAGGTAVLYVSATLAEISGASWPV